MATLRSRGEEKKSLLKPHLCQCQLIYELSPIGGTQKSPISSYSTPASVYIGRMLGIFLLSHNGVWLSLQLPDENKKANNQ
jgi:hypothetical protein